MTLRELIQGELIDIVEWLEQSPDEMAWRFDRPNNELKNGARLIVRPGQLAVFVEQGAVADVFQPGTHELTTRNLPVLSKLRGWKFGFQSPFRAEVVFVSTRQFTNNRWGTKTPVMMHDASLGPIRLRAYGTFAVRVEDAGCFVRELVGANASYGITQISEQLRDLVVARFGELLAERAIPVLELAENYRELGDAAAVKLDPDLARFGLELTQLVVESIALPDEVAATLDQRTRIGLIGDLGAYARLQAADAVREAARNPGGAGGVAVGVGLALAQQLAGTTGQALRPSAEAPVVPPPIPSGLAGPAAPPPLPGGFFIAVQGSPSGPWTLGELREQVKAGTLRRETLVWREGMAGWTAASQVAELAPVLGT